MQRTACKPAWALAVVIACAPALARAQEPEHAESAARRDGGEPSSTLLELGVSYGGPGRLSGSVSGLFLKPDPKSRNGISGKALTTRAAAGQGAFSAGLGYRAPRYLSFGPEALITVSRTSASPRAGTGQSTYVGVEVGYVSLGRASIGVAHQVDGPSNRRDTILTWTVGVQFPYGFWRW